jgi:hypothetical protein
MRSTTTQSRRTFVPWFLVGTLVAAASVAAVVGASTPRQIAVKSAGAPQVDATPTGFGGYKWPGEVDEIEAEWRVPRVLSTAQYAGESTWIGVQGRGTDYPFIQLGTLANVNDSPFLESGGGTKPESPSAPQLGQTDYEIFWSDTTQGFHPVTVVGLEHPGDLIRFKMVKQNDDWQLSVKNLTYGWSRSKLVRYGQNDSFTQGEWLQEDPASGSAPGVDIPYADTSPIRFQDVRVNDVVPRFHYRDEGALSTQDGVYLVPTSFVGDSFSLVRPTGAALQYISDAETVDASLSRIGGQIDWVDHSTASTTAVAEVKQLAGLYRESARLVDTQIWPAPVRKASGRFVISNYGLARRLTEWADGNDHSLSQLRAIFYSAPARDAISNLRNALRLPQV